MILLLIFTPTYTSADACDGKINLSIVYFVFSSQVRESAKWQNGETLSAFFALMLGDLWTVDYCKGTCVVFAACRSVVENH